MGFFRPEIEATLKTLRILILIGLIAMPVVWGYEQRRQAKVWQSIACAYRVQEAARRAPIIAGIDYRRNPCETLTRLGLDLPLPP